MSRPGSDTFSVDCAGIESRTQSTSIRGQQGACFPARAIASGPRFLTAASDEEQTSLIALAVLALLVLSRSVRGTR
jgi:hypothetical protein